MVKIIIVDDESASLKTMGRVISGIRKDVEIAGLFNNINLAMDFLRENSVDIILSDIKMPGGGGIELARFVQENYPERKLYAVDTLCASMGQGLIVYLACKMKENGATIEEVRDYVENNKMNLFWIRKNNRYRKRSVASFMPKHKKKHLMKVVAY